MADGKLSIVEFGPVRGIGMAMRAKAGVTAFGAFWGEFGKRMGEIVHPANCAMFGVCRCVPGETDAPPGTFEYVALMEAEEGATVPSGMVEVVLPRGEYAAFEVAGFEQFSRVWREAAEAVGASKEWKGYCGAEGCECATHPGFEYYPPGSHKTGRAWVYVAVRKG